MDKNCIITDNHMEVHTKEHLNTLRRLNFDQMPFVPIVKSKLNDNYRLNFRQHFNCPGVFILKEKGSNKIFSLGKSISIYAGICDVLYKMKRINLFDDAELCVIRSSKALMPQVAEEVLNLHRLAPVNNLYTEFKNAIDRGTSLPIDLFVFKDIYEAKIVRPIFSFRYVNVPGVYIIMENEKIVYVGMGKQINKALYKHFEQYRKDRNTSHYRANYFVTREAFSYQAAVIEVPWIDRQREEIYRDTKALEDYLIWYLDPLDNKKGIITEDSIVFEKGISRWQPVVIDGIPVDELPF